MIFHKRTDLMNQVYDRSNCNCNDHDTIVRLPIRVIQDPKKFYNGVLNIWIVSTFERTYCYCVSNLYNWIGIVSLWEFPNISSFASI